MQSVKLGSIIHLEKGKKAIKLSSVAQNGWLPYVDVHTFETKAVANFTDGEKCLPCKNGEILIVCDGSRSGLVGKAIDGYVGSTLAKISAEGVIPEYLFYYLQEKYPKLNTQKKGTGTPHLNQALLKDEIINIPSVDEQFHTVAYIDEIFLELDKVVDTLKKVKEQLAVYRQAVLVDAFRVATNSTHLKIGYVCAKIVDCPHSTPKWEKNGKLCLRTTNFKRGYLDLQSPNYVSEETFNDRNRRIIPQPGDVLYSREGSVLGIACTIPSNVYPCLGQRMMLLRSGEKLNNRYLMHYLNSPMVTNHVIATKGGTGSPHINVGDIKEFQIPIPSLEEQSNIVRQIEEQLSSCDNVEKTVDAILTQADAMRQSILKQAFEGTL